MLDGLTIFFGIALIVMWTVYFAVKQQEKSSLVKRSS